MPVDPRLTPVYRAHDVIRAHYDKLSESRNMMDKIRRELDGLLNLGDTVTPDDVVKSTGLIIGHGIAASDMADMLKTMPSQGGAPLASWIEQQDAMFTKMEMQVDKVKTGLQHQLGVAGLRVLAAQHWEGQGEAPVQSGSMTLNAPAPAGGMA